MLTAVCSDKNACGLGIRLGSSIAVLVSEGVMSNEKKIEVWVSISRLGYQWFCSTASWRHSTAEPPSAPSHQTRFGECTQIPGQITRRRSRPGMATMEAVVPRPQPDHEPGCNVEGPSRPISLLCAWLSAKMFRRAALPNAFSPLSRMWQADSGVGMDNRLRSTAEEAVAAALRISPVGECNSPQRTSTPGDPKLGCARPMDFAPFIFC